MRRLLNIVLVLLVVLGLSPALWGTPTMQVGSPSASYWVHQIGHCQPDFTSYDANCCPASSPNDRFDDGPNTYDYVGQNPWTRFDPEGLFWDPDSGFWGPQQYGQFLSGLFVDPAVESYHSGEQHMEQGFDKIENGHGAGDRFMGGMFLFAAVGDAASAPLNYTPEGKAKEALVKGGEKLVREGEQTTAKAVEAKATQEAAPAVNATSDAKAAAASTPSGSAVEDAQILVRRGVERESAGRLGGQSAAAEKAGVAKNGVPYGHGVSVTTPEANAVLSKNPADVSQTTRGALEDAGFEVRHTPTSADPTHHTVQLPKPVTPEDAARFNQVFGR